MAEPDYAVPDSSGPDYTGLIRPDRVHGSLYTDPRVFAGELARIWYRTWVYVGHESEVAEPGDYARKTLGRQDTIEAELSLAAVPRVAEHQGFVFGSMAADGPSLAEHLGEAAGELDRLARLSPEGKVELTAGWLRHRTRANWKLLAENETDGYHPQFVHGSIFSVTQSPIGALYSDNSTAVTRNPR